MDKESIIERQCIDYNCNDCKHMNRDMEKRKEYDPLWTNSVGQITTPSFRAHYGFCKVRQNQVSFIPNICMPENSGCFEHRRK